MLAMIPKNHPNHRKGKGALDSVDDRETPASIWEPLNDEYRFTLDAAANHHNAKCPLYGTLKGLYASTAGRIVAVHEEDEVGGRMPGLDWSQTPEGVWLPVPASEAQASEVAGPSLHLRMGVRRYTARHDGVSPVRQSQLREPLPPLFGYCLRQYEGLFPEGETGWPFCEWAQADDTLEAETRGRRTGLDISWAGHRVFVNPPFSWLLPWVEKAWDESQATTVMVLPNNRSEQGFWQKYIEPYRDRVGSILTTRHLAKRRPFLHLGKEIGNRTSKSPPFGIVIVIWDRRESFRNEPANDT